MKKKIKDQRSESREGKKKKKTGKKGVGKKTAPKSDLKFSYAIRSFMGYLEGTHKASHTIKNYRLDILSFETFLRKSTRSANTRGVELERVTRDHLEAFHDHLKKEGLKTNTRRRKLLTVRNFIQYLNRRKKLPEDVAQQLPAPYKVERIPYTVDSQALLEAIQKLSQATELEARNRALLWTLAETGCLVSEVTQLKFSNWSSDALEIQGRNERTIPVSKDLAEAIQGLKATAGGRDSIFLGHKKFGSLGAPITSRGVEMLVRTYRPKLVGGDSPDFDLTPRTFRHSAVLRWHSEGLTQPQIQKLLGLKSEYAFRAYALMFKKPKAESNEAEK